MDKSAASRRTNRRLTGRLACQLTVRYKSGKTWHPATAMDLSRMGCRLRLGEDLPRETSVQVAFETPIKDGARAYSVELEGRVIWCRLQGLSFQAGIQFLSEPEALHDVLSAIG